MTAAKDKPEKIANVVSLADVKPERISWLWPGRLPLGKLIVLDGDPGLGKTTLLFDLAARVSAGRAMPDGTPGVMGGVVIMSAEDGLGDTIRPRLEAAGADLSRVDALTSVAVGADERPPMLPIDVDALEETIRNISARLVVIDPLMAYLSGDVNARQDQDVRRALAAMAAMAERTGAAVVCVRHLNKATGGSALYRGGGSIGIIGASRVGLLVAPDPDDPDVRVLAITKNNLSPHAPSLSFRLESVADSDVARVVWTGESNHTADSLLNRFVPGQGGENEVDQFLRSALANGPVASNQVYDAAKARGISRRTLERSKERLGAKSKKDGQGQWLWYPPAEAPNIAKIAKIANIASYSRRGDLGGSRKIATSPTDGEHGEHGDLGDLGPVRLSSPTEPCSECERSMWRQEGSRWVCSYCRPAKDAF